MSDPFEQRTLSLAEKDKRYVWHPFTPMKQWMQDDPMIIEGGEGFELIDTDGRRYVDGFSSLWCNLHGHRVPQIDAAIRDQLENVAHTTLLGFASPPSIELGERLVRISPEPLKRVFYSDSGATAVEIALKMAYQYYRNVGQPERRRFLALRHSYHGDTIGSVSLGGINTFHEIFHELLFETTFVDTPNPYHNEHGEQAMHVVLNQIDETLRDFPGEYCALVLEPLMQGAAGMVCQPEGFLAGVRKLCDKHDVLLIADEVAVGFGRTGKLFACEHEKVVPDLLCLAKGISGGYLPLAATVVTDAVDAAFTGELSDRRTLFHGHTYTGNPLACAVAIESLKKFSRPVAKRSEDAEHNASDTDASDDQRFSPDLLTHIRKSASLIKDRLEPLRDCRRVADIRQRGIMVGIEVCEDRAAPDGPKPFDFAALTARRLTNAMREHGVIVRNLGDVVILMPIPAMPHDTLEKLCDAVVKTILEWPIEG
ncbi:MAG: adenosylmethionine--8-amino-7-oxononanoate transaminase [Phycisphaeraceae bacterium]